MTQRIAGHADSRTTKLYERRDHKVLTEDMERMRYFKPQSVRGIGNVKGRLLAPRASSGFRLLKQAGARSPSQED
jgi:hypothetical protein